LWQLAEAATTLRILLGLPTEIQEATAAIQDVAWQFATAPGAAGDPVRAGAVREIQAHLQRGIQLQVNGPYLVTNAENLVNRWGEQMPTRPQMALCRCGASKLKPFCDGSHADISFTDGKDPKRVPDRRDTHAGLELAVLDNRGTCAHSGFCTDRLPSAFHLGQEPFVTASGARQDDVIRAVRTCPSGALSYAIDGPARPKR
jgi:CDGSH-type Zn-finger protein/ferredoxin